MHNGSGEFLKDHTSIDFVPILFYSYGMNFENAIERQRKPLLHIILGLFAMIGFDEGEQVGALSASLYRAVLRVLRPAESAVRRLIVVAARGLAPAPRPLRSRTAVIKPRSSTAAPRQPRIIFGLFDPHLRPGRMPFGHRQSVSRRHVHRLGPRITVIDAGFDPRTPLFRHTPPPPVAPPPQAHLPTVNPSRLCRRLLAVRQALENLPHQARRYARWLARPLDQRRPKRTSALRPGRPPGHRKIAILTVDEILQDCDWLAREARQSDTS